VLIFSIAFLDKSFFLLLSFYLTHNLKESINPCDFSNINGYPHAIPEKAIEKLPSFQGNNVVSAKMHVKSFMRCINKWFVAHDHEDVKMKLFVLSLEEDASDGYED
jgi:hypothetical protein